MNDDQSYPWVIALLNGEPHVNPAPVVRQALQNNTPSLLRAEWSILAKIAEQNTTISQLTHQHLALIAQVEDLQLILQDAKNYSPQNLDETQNHAHQQNLQTLQSQLSASQAQLENVDQILENLQDQSKDLLQQFRKNMATEFQALAQTHQTYIQVLINNLVQIDEPTRNQLTEALYTAVRHPEVEAELLANVKQQAAKGLTSKLKGWLSASKFTDVLQPKILAALTAVLPAEST